MLLASSARYNVIRAVSKLVRAPQEGEILTSKNIIGTKVASIASLVFGVLALAVTPASAAVIFVFEGTSIGPVVGGLPTTLFTYDINFQTNTDLGTGLPSDRFVGDTTTYGTLYDVPGFLNATLTIGAPFTFTTQSIGKTPVGIAPTDTSITNITVTYTGPLLTNDMSFPLVFVVDSTLSGLNNLGQYAGQDIKNAGNAAGTPATNFGFVTLPASAVPEPSTFYAFAGGIGLLLVGRIRRLSRN